MEEDTFHLYSKYDFTKEKGKVRQREMADTRKEKIKYEN